MRVLLEGALQPAEICCVLLALAGLTLARPLPSAPAPLAALVGLLSCAAAVARERSARAALGDLPLQEWAGLVAVSHASAMRIAALGASLAALLLAVSPRRAPDPPARHTLPLSLAGLSAALALPLDPSVLLVLPCALALPIAARGASARVAPSALLAALAAPAASLAGLYRAAALFDVEDLALIDRAMLGLGLTLLGALLYASVSLRALIERRSLALAVASALVLLAAACVGWEASQTLSLGPARVESASLPFGTPARATRPSRGCLVAAGESDIEAVGGAACPDALGGSFGREPVLFAGRPESPSASLLSLGSDVGVLVRMDEGFALPRWRIAALPVAVRDASDPARKRLLPDPLVAERVDGRWLAQGVPLDQAVAARARRSPRLDVAVSVEAAPALSDLIEVCTLVSREAAGARCALVSGPLSEIVPPPLIEEPIEFETVITDD